MKEKTSIMVLIVAFCLCLVLIQPQVKTCTAEGSAFKLVDMLLDYGNGTRKWTSCILQAGNDTVYNATQLVATSLNVSWCDGAAFIDAIDNVWNSYPYYWMWWIWNSSAGRWELGPVACNQYALEDCDMVAWYYEDCTTWPPSPPPNPPAKRVDVLLDYGNGTRVSYEDVEVLGFASVLKATKMVAAVEISLWGTDAFVEAIDNIWNDHVNYVFFWIYWYWNQSTKCWEMGQVAANKHVLANGDTIAWLYEDCTVWPPASPPVTKVDILLDYGNTTRVWYENVELPGTPSVLKATKAVASVEYTLWGTDVFVDAINGVWNDYVSYYFWIWWYWNHTAKGWECGPVACNKYMLADGDVIAWYYENCTVWPVEPPPLTPHPTASFTWTPSIPKVGQTVTFDASASVPNGGTIIDYAWNFGDGSISHGQIVVHAYSSPGTYTITLNVTDSNGLWDVEQKQITVVQPHGPKADFKVVPETARVGESIKFDASTSLPGWNGTHTMPITEYRWNFGDGNVTVTSQPVVYHRYSAAGNYYVTLTVYSPGATPETDSTTVKVTVFAVPVGGQSVSIETPQNRRSLEIYAVSVAIITTTFAVVKRNIAKK